jgi:hypothetical protein
MSLKRVAHFDLLERIGEGGMGEVFRAIDTMLEREVAIKALRPELAARADLVERFRVEAIALAKLNHPNIATVYSFLRDHETCFMVMQYVPGHTLEHVLHQRTRLPWQEALGIVAQTLRALQHAHALGVIHRDLKPANLMVRPDGGVVVMDFGIARVLARARQTRSGNMVGTLEYNSPEQVQGKDVDGRADLYSLGVMLYEMLTGRLPFIADTEYELLRAHVERIPPPPRDLCRELPEAVEAIVMKAMAKDPGRRFADAGQFALAVEALLPGGAARPGHHTPATPPPALDALGRGIGEAASSVAEHLSSAAGLAVSVFAGLAGGAKPAGGTQPEAAPARSRPHRWTDAALVAARRNPGFAVAAALAVIALMLVAAAGLRSPQPSAADNLPPEVPVIPAVAPAASVPSLPGVTIVADKPKPVAPFPNAGTQSAGAAPPPVATVKVVPPAPRPAPEEKATAVRRSPPPAPPPQQKQEPGWYVRK